MGSELYPWPRKFKITKTLSYPLRVNPNEPVNHLDRQMPHRKPYLDGLEMGLSRNDCNHEVFFSKHR